jgi:isopentenyl diphosphate isomerase/L-lactate dehydrogenase-like FMN-dependent dehydrogenase
VLGRRISMPVVIAPTGFIRIVHADGERGAALAAADASIPMAISTLGGVPAADVTAINPDTWFQLYTLGGREGTRQTIDLARAAGCRVLVVTVDVNAITARDRPQQSLPTHIDLASALRFVPQAWNRPRWLYQFLCGGLAMPVPNAPRNTDGSTPTLAQIGALLTATPPTWDDLAWIRSQWQGPLVVKGILRPADARLAVSIGANAVSVSNHGAKTLDGTVAPLDALPAVVDAVGRDAEVLLDGGARRGADVVRACALGARAVMIGRPYLWGLAVDGQAGVARVLRLFRHGVSATLAQLGCPSIVELDASYVVMDGVARYNRASESSMDSA